MFLDGWMNGWMDVKHHFKDCFQQSKIPIHHAKTLNAKFLMLFEIIRIAYFVDLI